MKEIFLLIWHLHLARWIFSARESSRKIQKPFSPYECYVVNLLSTPQQTLQWSSLSCVLGGEPWAATGHSTQMLFSHIVVPCSWYNIKCQLSSQTEHAAVSQVWRHHGIHNCLRLHYRAFMLLQLHFTVLLSYVWTTMSKGCCSLQQRKHPKIPHVLQSASLFMEVPLCLIWVLKKYHHSIKTLMSVFNIFQ